jgi:hypothetical protein
MNWAGSTIYVLQAFKPITKPAIKWIQKSDGNWSASDRGASEDVFEADVVFSGPEAELANLEAELGTVGGDNPSQRQTFSLNLGSGEEIFGADIDISGALTITVVDYGKIVRNSFASFSMPLRLRLPSPSYTGVASISSLRIADNTYEPNSEFDLMKSFTLDGSATYLDGETDPGIFRAVFRQTFAEMKAIRRYLLTTARTSAISHPASLGVSEPYGQRMGSGPFTCKVIDWNDQGKVNYIDWELGITFARVI